MRLSQEDERQGESLSIENQRRVLRKYAEDNGFEIYDVTAYRVQRSTVPRCNVY